MTPARTITPANAYRSGIWLALAAIFMMFLGLTSAYVVSQGLGPAWRELRLQPLMIANTAVLLACSAATEFTRKRGSQTTGLLAALALGTLFLAGQIGVFSQLASQGLYLSTGRQVSFFYVLAGLHAAHVLGGLGALLRTIIGLRRESDPRRFSRVGIVAVYWHFLAFLWLYLLAVIFL